MNRINYFIIPIFFIVPICTSKDKMAIAPRGVPLSSLPLYDPLKDFVCFDRTLRIPFTYVNDDYCDCLDGSDEPGTAACPNGIFHCANRGYISANIPSSRVNDGFCDCCDASDEYLTNNCTDVCEELGKEAKEQADKLAKLVEQGNLLRLQLVASAKKTKQAKQERFAQLEAEKAEAQKLKEETEAAKTEAEAAENAALEVYREKEQALKQQKAELEKEESRKEAIAAFEHLDSNQDKLLQVEEIRTRQVFDQNKDGEVSEDEVKFFLDDKTELDETYFVDIVWPRLKPLYMLAEGLFIPPPSTTETSPDVGEGEIHEENEQDEGDEEVEGEDEDKDEQEWNKDSDQDHPENEHSESQNLEDQGLVYDEQTKALIEAANNARTQFESAQKALHDLEHELNQLGEVLSKDYGPEDEFAPLDGQCFSFSDREYTYKLCPFDYVVQASKSGSSETRLGAWAGWTEQGSYASQMYTKGQSCWNGPQRSTKVVVSCGLENALVSASEPNKCEYLLEFETPAACKPAEKESDQHDEL